MSSQNFYLLGDAITTSRPVAIDSNWKFEDLKRAVALEFHIAQPSGMSPPGLDLAVEYNYFQVPFLLTTLLH
jgi:hypothetical protein